MALLLALAAIYLRMNVMEPAVIMLGTMTFSAFFAMLALPVWGGELTLRGWIYLFASMVMFACGSIWCKRSFFRSGLWREKSREVLAPYRVDAGRLCLCLLLMAVLAYFSFQEFQSVAEQVRAGAAAAAEAAQAAEEAADVESMSMFKLVRHAVEAKEVELSRWMNYRLMVAQMITYVYMFIFLHNLIFFGFRFSSLPALLPMAAYAPFMAFTTGRMALLCLVVYTVIVAGLIYQKKYGLSWQTNKKLLLIMLLGGVSFIGLFLVMGMLTGKGLSDAKSPVMVIAHYAGLSIPAFGRAVELPVIEDGFIGSHTMIGIYRILSRLGLELPQVETFLPFMQIGGIDTNVYTAQWRYFLDFGLVGLLAILWLMGVGYTFLYNYLKTFEYKPFLIMFYGIIAVPLFLSSIDERLLMDFLGTQILYDLLVLFVVYKLLLKTQNTADVKYYETER